MSGPYKMQADSGTNDRSMPRPHARNPADKGVSYLWMAGVSGLSTISFL
jgi:hypothetical protein